MLKVSTTSCGPPEVRGEQVADLVLDAVAQPVLGDDLAPDAGARLEVQHPRVQRRMALAERRRVPAVPARDVEQRPRLLGGTRSLRATSLADSRASSNCPRM